VWRSVLLHRTPRCASTYVFIECCDPLFTSLTAAIFSLAKTSAPKPSTRRCVLWPSVTADGRQCTVRATRKERVIIHSNMVSVLRDAMCVYNTAKSRTGKRRSLLAWRQCRLAAFRFYCVSFSNVFGGSGIPLWYKVRELSISRQLVLTLWHQREWDLTGYWRGTAWQMAVTPITMKDFPHFEQIHG